MTTATANRRQLLIASGGGLLALVVAVGLFTRFSLDGNLWRDESIYVYGGQQLVHGVPPYLSIFDPKTPLATILAWLGAVGGGWLGVNDVHAIRLEFFTFACLAVAAVYLLALWIWNSALVGIASAVTFASFKGFAHDALEGPDAKTPGIFFAVLSMALIVRRHWFWAAFTGSLAFLVWQPLVIYPAVAVVWAVLASEGGQRWRCGMRALAGAILPVAATTMYFLIAGALPQFIQAAVTFPLTGVRRANHPFSARIDRIADVVGHAYGNTSFLFWGGLIVLLALLVVWLVRARGRLVAVAREPVVGAVVVTFLGIAAFTLTDFQGYPDLYPVLPYAALGVGAAVALVARRIDGGRLRTAATGLVVAGVAILVGLSWSSYSNARRDGPSLRTERSHATKLNEVLAPGETLYALGNPTPLVLTRRRNPSRYIYLDSGVDEWVIHRTPGGLQGWEAQIRAADPAVITMSDWTTPTAGDVRTWLRSTYGTGTYLGHWLVFATPAVRARAARRGISL